MLVPVGSMQWISLVLLVASVGSGCEYAELPADDDEEDVVKAGCN